MANIRRGLLIVLEGLDRAGKTTQCERLCKNLESRGHKVKRMRFPGKQQFYMYFVLSWVDGQSDRITSIGKSIDAYLKGETQAEDHVVHLLFSANRWEAAAQIKKDISEGTTLLVDRYSYSGAVYSAAKRNPELSLDWAWQMEVGLPQPDLCLFLDISPEEARARGGFGSEIYEKEEMQRTVRELFNKLFTMACGKNSVIINAGKPLELVEQKVLQCVIPLFTTGTLNALSALEPMQNP